MGKVGEGSNGEINLCIEASASGVEIRYGLAAKSRQWNAPVRLELALLRSGARVRRVLSPFGEF